MDWLIFGSINIIIMVLMFLFLSRRLHRQYNSRQFMTEMQQEVNAIITEMNQTTERNLQLIEDRMEQLAAMTAQLDKRIMMAKAAEDKRSETSGTYSQIQEQKRQIQREMAQPPRREMDLFAATADAMPPPVQAETTTPPNQPINIPKPTASAPPVPLATENTALPAAAKIQKLQGREAMKAQVGDMAQAGIAPSLIAQHFGISLGEVELIISLQAGR